MEKINISFIVRTIIFAIILSTPIIIYIFTFGSSLSTEHERWSQFGSFISGIYAPIISILTITILLKQIELQHKYNTHVEDQAFIFSAREDLKEYITKILDSIDKSLPSGNTYRSLLLSNFQPKTLKELETDEMQSLAKKLNHSAPTLFDSWSSILIVMEGLNNPDSMPYELTAANETQKIIASLSFKTCVALDNYHRALTEGKLKHTTYIFSPLLSD